jgi:hypothetical protein
VSELLPNSQIFKKIQNLYQLKQKYYLSIVDDLNSEENNISFNEDFKLKLKNNEFSLSESSEKYKNAIEKIDEEIMELRNEVDLSAISNPNLDYRRSIIESLKNKKLQRENSKTKAKIRNNRIQQRL